ncbi:TauD/TfdA family dioxygenase [Frankia sp. Mgl5]|uniref:TauD/TfdA dioxygenase family protein n=1 Tax=Frankia sp. Mgl5 TaxID=2933793 RepID=UPI00200EFF15|nr:TauD/TfdA family dioxygenase [Frankia sp. Mgl5]MCK9928947.1 TauD/TfdA family dioxygenase [Frankia sp. Mgl5]
MGVETTPAQRLSTVGSIRFEKVTGNIGAIVHGVDVHVAHGDEVASVLLRSLHEHGVLFFHSDTAISGEQFSGFSSVFGEQYVYPYGKGPGQFVTEEGADAVRLRTSYWHTDGSPQEKPPQAALLCSVEVPAFGGDTMWASMTAAFDALSSRYQRLFDGMEAVHSTAAVARYHDAFGQGESHVHPVVITDPVTRRKALYVNSVYTERLVGMSERENETLLRMLYEHVNTPEFHVRLRWQPNMIAVWEERVTQHRAVADYAERRVLRRITITGDRPKA